VQALDYSDRNRDTKPRLFHIISSTRGIVFLGTPHRGSPLASLAKVVAFVAQAALHSVNDSLIRDLESESGTLDRIGDNFSRLLEKRTFSVWSFIEELPVTGGRKVYHTRFRGSELLTNLIVYRSGRV
jgi:hypothetical protein